MATKKKATADAPALKKPVRRMDGQPTRAEKRIVNKAVKAASTIQVKELVAAHKATGVEAVGSIEAYSGWTAELGPAMYKLIATGHGMREIAKIHGMPPLVHMLTWLTEGAHPFADIYARAKQAVVALYEEDIQSIGVTSNPLSIVTKKQVLTRDGDIEDIVEERVVDNVERSKLAAATLQWTLSHLRPKKHGRNPEGSAGKNEQLEGLFAALKAGPSEPKG